MTMTKVQQLARYFVEHVPGAGRTQIAKYLYLADLQAHRSLGRPISDLMYRWNAYGPFDRGILDALDSLRDRGFIEEERIQFLSGGECYRYKSTGRPVTLTFSDSELGILNYIVTEYGSLPLRELLEEVVYETEPMRDVRERNAFGERLNLRLVDNQERIPGLELERLWMSWRQAEEGQIRPLAEIMDELGSPTDP